jgi:AraC-like DNA-binding protein
MVGIPAHTLDRMSPQPPPVDPLGEALYFLRMTGTYYSSCEFTAPWGLVLPAFPGALMFHVVTSGRCWLGVGDSERRLLEPGDLALVPHGTGHRLASDPGARGVPLAAVPREEVSERFEILRQGGGGATTRLVCGTVRFDHPVAQYLVSLLPNVITVDTSASDHGEWIHSTLRFMAAEARALRPGGETVITRLADVLVIQAVRAWIERDGAARVGWLGALRDKQVGRALTLIHRDPARAWTLRLLASEVAMSRSAFAARFAELVGEPPMHYLARWRMRLAAAALSERAVGLGELASGLGYQSEAAFSRAFKRVVGVAPGTARRRVEVARPTVDVHASESASQRP